LVGTTTLGFLPNFNNGFFGIDLENSSCSSSSAIILNVSCASCKFNANIETQSSDLHAGTTPEHEKTPFVGFNPIRLFNAAGTLPDPAVSVPNAIGTIPLATTEADPAEDPPLTYFGLNVFGVIP